MKKNRQRILYFLHHSSSSQVLLDHHPILRDMDPWLEYYFLATPTRERIKVDPDVEANFESRIR